MGTSREFPDALKRHIRRQVIHYLASYPGFDTKKNNMMVHRCFRACVREPEELSDDIWEVIWKQLQYRNALMLTAQRILSQNEIEYTPVNEWSSEHWRRYVQLNCADTDLHLRWMTILVYFNWEWEVLFPQPMNHRVLGRRWRKPQYYLAAALAESPLETHEIDALMKQAYKDAKQMGSGVDIVLTVRVEAAEVEGPATEMEALAVTRFGRDWQHCGYDMTRWGSTSSEAGQQDGIGLGELRSTLPLTSPETPQQF